MRILVLFLMSAALFGQSFSDDFEIGYAHKWPTASTSGGGSYSVCTTGCAHSGLYALQVNMVSYAGYAYQQIYWPIITSDNAATTMGDVSVRVWFYIPSAFTINDGGELQIMWLNDAGGGTQGQERVILHRTGTNLYLKTRYAAAGNTNVTRDAWHSVEMAYHGAAGTGTVALYLDGSVTPETSASTLTLPTDISQFRIGGLTGATGISGTFYLDDAVLSASAIGASAVGVTVRHADPYGRSVMPLHLTLWGQTASDQISVLVDGGEVYHKTGSIAGVETGASVTLTSLTVADHTLSVKLLDSGGTQKAISTETIHKYVAGDPTVHVDGDNNIVVNGTKTFLVTPFLEHATGDVDSFADVYKPSGYVNYYGWMSGNSTTYSSTGYLTFLNAIATRAIGPDQRVSLTTWNTYLGVDCTIPANQYVYPCLPVAMTAFPTEVASYINAVKTSPYVLGWNWQDEPDSGGTVPRILPSALLAAKATVKANDGNYPSFQNLYGYSATTSAADAGKGSLQKGFLYPNLVADVYGFDNYLYVYQGQSGIPTVAQWLDLADRYQKYNFGLTPWMTFIECGIQTGGSATNQGPNVNQMHMMAWLSVIHGLKGISWWGPEVSYTTVDSAHHAEMAAFTSAVGALTNQILGKAVTVSSNQTTAGSRVDVMARNDGTSVWVFSGRVTDDLANSSEATATALSTQLSVPGFGNGTATVYGESRTVPVVAGVITDNFAPYAVHIYQLNGAAAATTTSGKHSGTIR